jgi:hypothetical protein
MKVTQTGIGRMVAVRNVSRPPSKAMLIVSATNGGMMMLLERKYRW